MKNTLLFFLLSVLVSPAWSQNDSTAYLATDMRFDSLESTNRYIHPSGLSLRYPPVWTRDMRVSNNELVVYLRKNDPVDPYKFRELLTVTAETVADTNATLQQLTDLYTTMTEKTWEQYDIFFEVLAVHQLAVNGIPVVVVRARLPKLSQEKLIFIFARKQEVFTMEYTASDITFLRFTNDIWKVANSMAFLER